MTIDNKEMKDDDFNYDEFKTSIFKLTFPIGRFKFFVNQIILFFMLIIIYFLFIGTLFTVNLNAGWSVFTRSSIVIVVFGLAALYLYGVSYAARMWDILGNQKTAIITAIVLLLISLTGYGYIAIAIALSAIKGKMIK